jgi:hypothetical protein
MKGGDFKRWALRGCRIYGEDRWFFLRELAQNARDAGARNVRVAAERDGTDEILIFADDGSGMDSRHAEQFLFRLYASSKEDERGSAGQFGIGFWAVLRFGPQNVRIASNAGRSPWAVSIDEDFELHQEEAAKQPRGTTITLRRPARFDTEEEYVNEVGAALSRFCRYLRRNDREATPLPVWFQERNVIEEMSVPGPISLSFRHGPVEGAVGLGKRPSVELYARGLPVWKGLLLDELSYRGTEHAWRSEIAQGLAPCFVLNGNRLNVVMSRNAVVDDGALAALRRHAGRSLQQLVKHQLQKTLPVGPVRRTIEWLRTLLVSLGRLPVVTLLPLALALGIAVAVWYFGAELRAYLGFAPPPPVGAAVADRDDTSATDGAREGVPPGSGPVPGRLPSVYRGSLVERLPSAQAIALRYSPADSLHFKFLTATDFDPSRGFVALNRIPEDLNFEATGCIDGRRTKVLAELQDTGLISLPIPTGHALVPGTLSVDGRATPAAAQTPAGEPLVRLSKAGELSYETCATVSPEPPSPEPEVIASKRLSDGARNRLHDVAGGPVKKRVKVALSIVRAHIRYDDSEAAAALYAQLGEGADWLSFVLTAGRGDCDVMNALAILLLHEVGVPARLGIGGVGRKGRLLAGLHAWVEYYDGQWRVADASAGQTVTLVAGGEAGSLASPLLANGGSKEPVAERGTDLPGEVVGHAGPGSSELDSGARSANGPGSRRGGPTAIEPVNEAWGPHTSRLLAGVLAALALFVFLALWYRRTGRRAHVAASLDGERAEELLGDMALSAALQPGAWAHADALWGHPLLPLIGRRTRLSLRQAERRATRGHLFAGGALEENGLASLAAAAGTPVLDAGHKFFGRLAGQLAGIVDLDRVDSLRPQVEAAVAGRGFVADASAILRAAVGNRAVPLVVCPGLSERALLDVDLRGAKLPPEWRGFRRFVAVRPDGELEVLAARHHEGDPGARLALVDLVSRQSRYYRKDGAAVRNHCARVLLKEGRS